jgi:hypothetical protein
MQIKQDRIIPVFRCQVIETIVSQYCGHWSSSGITRYIRFREPKALEAWECRQARTNRKVVIGGRTVQTTIGATMSHAAFMSGAMDDDSNCEAGIISFPIGMTLGGKTVQGLYEITLREEFARLRLRLSRKASGTKIINYPILFSSLLCLSLNNIIL